MEYTYFKVLEYFEQSLLFLFGQSNIEHLNFPYIIFLISTSSIGLLCVFLDYAYYKITNGKSIFNLSYIGIKGTLLMFLFWGVGAGIVGYLSLRLNLIAFSVQASIIVGLGWPLLFPKLYEMAKINISEIEPEEIPGTELDEESDGNSEED